MFNCEQVLNPSQSAPHRASWEGFHIGLIFGFGRGIRSLASLNFQTYPVTPSLQPFESEIEVLMHEIHEVVPCASDRILSNNDNALCC